MEFKPTRYGICVPGFKAGGVKRGKAGFAYVMADEVCTTAAVYTKNSVKAAPVLYTKNVLKNGLQAIAINSGNANCATASSEEDAKTMAEYASKFLNIDKKHIGVASTGIIGKPMEMQA